MTPLHFATLVHVDEATCFRGRVAMEGEEFTVIDIARNKSADYMRHTI